MIPLHLSSPERESGRTQGFEGSLCLCLHFFLSGWLQLRGETSAIGCSVLEERRRREAWRGNLHIQPVMQAEAKGLEGDVDCLLEAEMVNKHKDSRCASCFKVKENSSLLKCVYLSFGGFRAST